MYWVGLPEQMLLAYFTIACDVKLNAQFGKK